MLPKKFCLAPIAAGLSFIVMAALSGCTPPPHGTPDYADAHPIKVVDKNFHLNVDLLTTDEGLVPINLSALYNFVREYHRRGNTHLFVFPSKQLSKHQRMTVTSAMEEQLWDFGVQRNLIVSTKISPNADQRPNVVVISFSGTEVKVPECGGDWSGEAGYNPTNMPRTNFGCAYQRNIGLMVSNPQDLIKSDPSGASLSADTVSRIIYLYEQGLSTSQKATNKLQFKEDPE